VTQRVQTGGGSRTHPNAQILRESAGPHVDEFGGKIRVDGGGADKDFEAHRAGHFRVLVEGRRRIDEYVRPHFDGSLVSGPRGAVTSTNGPAVCRHGIVGIIDVFIGRLCSSPGAEVLA
jgi:hypothetical protein